ncbi:unnamed protein product [Mytilus coruscus]|uniref:CCHC-type domain-containing protein n=1 Tax=Mytilus coruscus TaxID=42192 RepID=A0A6J8BKF1_MYTCO|nr:unnamed protein product [Mytilus coruscus]
MAKSNEQNEPKMASYAEKTKTDPITIEPSDMVSVKPVFIQETDVFGKVIKQKDCINDWVCRSCGQEGHKQNACTKDTFSDAPDQSDKENNKSHETSDADDETSESETGTDATQISVKNNNTEICESASATGREGASTAECEGVSTTGCENDNGQSQSIINPVADPRKRKKIKKKKEQ